MNSQVFQIVAILLQFWTQTSLSDPNVIKILGQNGSWWAEEGTEYDISACNSSLILSRDGNITKLNMHGKCANFYAAENCSGWFIRLVTNQLGGLIFKPETFRWPSGEMSTSQMQAASVGPCFDKCDPRNWEGDKKGVVKVTLYEGTRHQGTNSTIIIDGDGCFLIPRELSGFESIKISGDENSCIELHSSANCGAESTQFRPGYPELSHLWVWGLGGERTFASSAKAISRCGVYCNKSVSDVNPVVEGGFLGENIITLYDQPGHYGHATDLNLTSGCITLNETGDHYSIQTYGKCVVLYEESNCTEKTGSYTLQSSGQGEEYYIEKLLTGTTPLVLKSVKLCDQNFEVIKKGEHVGETVKDSSSSISTWGIILLLSVSLMINFIGGVSCAVKWYKTNRRSGDDLQVLYKSGS